MMKTIPSTEAKTNFGVLLDTAQREPVQISRQGRCVAVVMSMQDYKKYEDIRFEQLRRDIQLGFDSIERGDVFNGEQVFDELDIEDD